MKYLFLVILTSTLYSCSPVTTGAAALNESRLDRDHFPVSQVSAEIIKRRGLEEQVEILQNECDWANKIGEKIDIFWLKDDNRNLLGHVYEYILDCDNLRLIYWYDMKTDELVDFMIEDLEEESIFVVAKRKHLKNRKKYRKYLKKD